MTFAPVPDAKAAPPMDIPSAMLTARLRDTIRMMSATADRSLQISIGASEIGSECDRQISYREHKTPAVNFPDPLRSLIGIGGHAVMADIFRRADGGSGRYLIEHSLTYRGVPGTCDLFDRWEAIVVDWKFPLLAKIRHLRSSGAPQARHVTQVQTYGAGLTDAGEGVERVALVHIPADGTLDDVWAWVAPFDKSVADEALDRRERLMHVTPDQAIQVPSALCRWCAHWRAGSSDLSVACPGQGD